MLYTHERLQEVVAQIEVDSDVKFIIFVRDIKISRAGEGVFRSVRSWKLLSKQGFGERDCALLSLMEVAPCTGGDDDIFIAPESVAQDYDEGRINFLKKGSLLIIVQGPRVREMQIARSIYDEVGEQLRRNSEEG